MDKPWIPKAYPPPSARPMAEKAKKKPTPKRCNVGNVMGLLKWEPTANGGWEESRDWSRSIAEEELFDSC